LEVSSSDVLFRISVPGFGSFEKETEAEGRYFFLHHGATAQNTPMHNSTAAGVVYSVEIELSPFRFIISIPLAIAMIPKMTKRTPNPVSSHRYFPFFPAG